jgi:deoxyadenosine/deoxycytidine kinase
LLAADAPEWSDHKRLTVSDFWFGQSLAFAKVWLPEERQEAYAREFAEVLGRVVRPKLIVLLELPTDEALERIRYRGRRCELNLTARQLDRIAQAILAQATQPNQGPLLRLASDDAVDFRGSPQAGHLHHNGRSSSLF